ncbi:phosphatidate cytidylyltransferase 2-like [Pseudorasbora parva]|uniref:phosphatidate cytidylyltransferase 2-like n=1 Tax=Pseudorasbora parva TaxID=51549 RepID=UPI00351E54F1
MVLLTLLGLTALLLRERREVKNTCSGQEKKVDQIDVPPIGITDGQTSQPITSDPDVLSTEGEPTSPPKMDDDGLVGDACAEDLHATNSVIYINACRDEIRIQQSEEGSDTEDKEKDGASDNEVKSDSGVPEVPIPTDDTPEVLNKVLSGLSSRLKNWWDRYLWEILTPAMISFFFFIIIVNLGPMALIRMMTVFFYIKCLHQIITAGYRVYHCYHMLWFRTLSLYFLLCLSYFFYGGTITDYFFTLAQREESVHMLSKYQHFIYFALYLVGFCLVVLSLVKKSNRLPFCMFVWTHVTLLIVAIHADLIIQNLFEEMIWFIAPISILFCNNIIDCMFGFILSHSY